MNDKLISISCVQSYSKRGKLYVEGVNLLSIFCRENITFMDENVKLGNWLNFFIQFLIFLKLSSNFFLKTSDTKTIDLLSSQKTTSLKILSLQNTIINYVSIHEWITRYSSCISSLICGFRFKLWKNLLCLCLVYA